MTFTTVFDSFGYCRIGNTVAALKPISRISRLTTTDSTGRLMKMSVQTIAVCSEQSDHGPIGSEHDLPFGLSMIAFGKTGFRTHRAVA